MVLITSGLWVWLSSFHRSFAWNMRLCVETRTGQIKCHLNHNILLADHVSANKMVLDSSETVWPDHLVQQVSRGARLSSQPDELRCIFTIIICHFSHLDFVAWSRCCVVSILACDHFLSLLSQTVKMVWDNTARHPSSRGTSWPPRLWVGGPRRDSPIKRWGNMMCQRMSNPEQLWHKHPQP